MSLTIQMPEGWTAATLADVGVWSSGGTPSKKRPEYHGGDIPWVLTGDLEDGPLIEIPNTITSAGLKNSSAKLFPQGTLLMAMYGATIGKLAVLGCEATTNQACAALLPSQANRNSLKYVYYFLLAKREGFKKAGKGGAQPNISQTVIKETPIPIAPLKEQSRIVEKIETLFARLDKGEEAVRDVQKLLTRYRQSVLKSAVTGQLTKSDKSEWDVVELGSLLTDIRYGTAQKCGYEPASTAVLRIPNVAGGEIKLDDIKYTDLSERDSLKLALELGDILIVRSNGSSNLIARGAVVREAAVGMSFAGYLIRLRLDQTRIIPDYLQMSMSSPQTRALIERQARSTSGVHNINSSEVKAISVELPPLSQQSEIMAAVDDALLKTVDLEHWCETELKRSASLRQSILKDAFAGKLVPQEPTDEPASALLARIAAEKPTPKKTRRKTSA